MVLAAGLGTRLRPFTDRIPKPLIPLYGVPCVEYALLSLQHAGLSPIAVNLHAHPVQMRQFISGFSRRSAGGVPAILESDESALLLGSAGGLRQGLDVLGGKPFLSMNADVIHLADLRGLLRAHENLRARYDVTMTLMLADGPVLLEQEGEYREILTDSGDGLIRGFGEKKRGVPFFTGTAVFEPGALSHLPAGVPVEFVPSVLEPAIRARKAGFMLSRAPWLDLGSPALWFRAEHRIRDWIARGVLPAHLKERLALADPTFGGRFELGKQSIRMDDIRHEIEDFRDP
jgi:NDP-sugar pyrophosphorylase family protein